MKILPQLLIGGLLFGAGLIGIRFAVENRGAETILINGKMP
jgi:glutamate synthase domain-containing protein 3